MYCLKFLCLVELIFLDLLIMNVRLRCLLYFKKEKILKNNFLMRFYIYDEINVDYEF